MVGEWKVTSNSFDGSAKVYAVYRLRNTSKTDHSGNREYATTYTSDKQVAIAIADDLNKPAIE